MSSGEHYALKKVLCQVGQIFVLVAKGPRTLQVALDGRYKVNIKLQWYKISAPSIVGGGGGYISQASDCRVGRRRWSPQEI